MLTHIKKKAKKEYYNQLISKNKNDSKRTWQVINEIINSRKWKKLSIKQLQIKNNVHSTDSTVLCQTLNKHFVENGPCLAKKLQNTNISYRAFLNKTYTQSLFINPTNVFEVTKWI